MSIESIIEKLETKFQRLESFLPEKKRLIYEEIEEKTDRNRGVLLYGPRGVGKTTFLIYYAKKNNLLYISAEDPIVFGVQPYELLMYAIQKYSGIIIDEVSTLPSWSLLVKTLYDSYPNKKFIVSDSSSILMKKSVADLSRRFILVKMRFMSFREFIYFETGKIFDKFVFPKDNTSESIEYIYDFSKKLIRQINVLELFSKYSQKGTRPFYHESNFREMMENILQKSVYYDVPKIVQSINENHFGVMKAVLSYLLYSKIPTINIEAMCRDWGIGKPKLYELLNALEEIELINIVHKKEIFKLYSKGAKIFLSDPIFYKVFDSDSGKFREAFVVFALKDFGKLLSAVDETKADYTFNGLQLEIRGKNKKRKESNFVIRDDTEVPFGNSLPMWLLGMMW